MVYLLSFELDGVVVGKKDLRRIKVFYHYEKKVS